MKDQNQDTTDTQENKKRKIFFLYIFISNLFILFLLAILTIISKEHKIPSKYATDNFIAYRGEIISADNFHLARTKKLYKAIVNTRYIDTDKKELFIELFSIYSGIDANIIRDKLSKKKGIVILSYAITEKTAKYLQKLSYELRRFKVFKAIKNPKTGLLRTHGLSIIESGESRTYPYGNLLTPVIGYPNKKHAENGFTFIKGIKGLERKFEPELSARQDGRKKGPRDVNSYIILNQDSYTKEQLNGLNLKLTIPVSLQIKIEKMLDTMKLKTQSKQIMIAIMDMKTSNIITIASSNRFFPTKIQRSDYSSLRSSMIEYSFEPGSVLKPITLGLLLDNKKIKLSDLVSGHKGRYKIKYEDSKGRTKHKKIIDEHPRGWWSPEQTIVHSSNIAIAQYAQELSGYEFREGLLKFGFSQKSTPDLISERDGSVLSANQLRDEIYKATSSYGYGIKANLMQLIRAYSVFNNDGQMLTPRIVDYLIDEKNQKIPLETYEPLEVIKKSTANILKKILIKTVNKGTGKKAIIKGLEIGGKTGTAHIVEKGNYVNRYNTSFMGFANDKNSKYTIGVVVIQPTSSQFASKTAVPVFRKAVEIMVEDGYLKPNIVK